MIVKAPNKVLTTKAKKVTKIDKKVLKIIQKLKSTLVVGGKPVGVGLAGPQIGVGLQIFICKPNKDTPIRVFLNPEIIWKSKDKSEIKEAEGKQKKKKKLEGCLSIPNVWGYLKRAKKVKLRFMNIKGEKVEEEFDGFMATIVQHETDHLKGVLFTQRVLAQKEKLFQIEKNEEGEDELVEIVI